MVEQSTGTMIMNSQGDKRTPLKSVGVVAAHVRDLDALRVSHALSFSPHVKEATLREPSLLMAAEEPLASSPAFPPGKLQSSTRAYSPL